MVSVWDPVWALVSLLHLVGPLLSTPVVQQGMIVLPCPIFKKYVLMVILGVCWRTFVQRRSTGERSSSRHPNTKVVTTIHFICKSLIKFRKAGENVGFFKVIISWHFEHGRVQIRL